MHYTGSDQTLCSTYVREPDIDARLHWLTRELEGDADRRLILRDERELIEARLMRRPLTGEQAYGRFGLLLGLLPPAALFSQALVNMSPGAERPWMYVLALVMLAVCGVVGRFFGIKLSGLLEKYEQREWWRMLIVPGPVGAYWGLVTGAVGGCVFFGIGAVGGVVCAVPVGAVAFAFFVPLHRLFARSGMIDARHFWPLATGVAATIATSILAMLS